MLTTALEVLIRILVNLAPAGRWTLAILGVLLGTLGVLTGQWIVVGLGALLLGAAAWSGRRGQSGSL